MENRLNSSENEQSKTQFFKVTRFNYSKNVAYIEAKDEEEAEKIARYSGKVEWQDWTDERTSEEYEVELDD